MSFHNIDDKIRPYIVRIETQDGTGTGFLFAYNESRLMLAIATALHVVSNAYRWKQPIRLIHEATKGELFLTEGDRIIEPYPRRDAASIVIPAGKLKFPENVLSMITADKYMSIGVELGWMGYPGVAYPQLCFFRGAVSAYLLDRECYLIDGVAINGVSGGPVFICSKEPELVGILSAYIPNPVGAQTLPGLAVAQDISPLYETITKFKNWDEARRNTTTKTLPPDKVSEPPQSPVPRSTPEKGGPG